MVLFTVVLLVCRWIAYELRFDFDVPEMQNVQLYRHWHWVVGLQLVCLLVAGQFAGIYRYFSLPDIQRLFLAMAASGGLLYGIRYLDLGYSPPRGVILIQCSLGFMVLGAIRTGWRVAYEKYYSRKDRLSLLERNVAIIGAGDAGASLVGDLRAYPRLGMVPVAFFDDNREKWGSQVHGVRVEGSPETIPTRKKKLRFEDVIIAMPSAPAQRLREVVSLLQKARIKYVTVPGIDQLTSGQVSVSQLRPVRIEDLLGREAIDLQADQISQVLKDRVVMVTGAGGSIGSELCRQVASFKPRLLLLVDQSEVQLFPIEQELIELGHRQCIQPLIADICDQERVATILKKYLPFVIFHAAAHKHVFMMERQPGEAIKNNSIGTARLAEQALKHGVERFVMISTDKAVNPTSAMGASKRLAEIYLQSLFQENPGKTRFSAVRFGNVLGSSGSVIPIFEKQIAKGGPVTVTDPNVVRFFMTIPEAVGLVLQTCALGSGGEVFVLDMGKAVNIADLARQMIRLSGLEPDVDIAIEYVGLRPGEKLYEELGHLRANCTDTAHARIKCFTSQPQALEKVRTGFSRLEACVQTTSPDHIRALCVEMMPEYTPFLENQDLPISGVDANSPAGLDEKLPSSAFRDAQEAGAGEQWSAKKE